MKKLIIFSAVLIVFTLAGVFVFAQSSINDKSHIDVNAGKKDNVKIEFFFHGNNLDEKDFVDSQKLKLSKKYSNKLNIIALDLDKKDTNYGIINHNMIAGAKNVVCVLNNKFFLANIESINLNITKYIDYILEPDKHQNPMLTDLLTTKSDMTEKIDSDTDKPSETNNTLSGKLVCDTYLHDLLKEIDKIHPFNYIAEAEVADIYVDVNFDKKLINSSIERFEKTLSTILNTYEFYFEIENDFYVIKQKPIIVSETFSLSSRIEFDDFVMQCMKLLQNNETLTTDKKAQVLYFIGSKDTYEKIDSFLKAILKTYEYDGK